ncbi:MAG: dTDP-4-dehydrorhamnose 3,5-epimerase family protein [Deltaproteobacteria bacterium]|jgi:dTDP-4-dehydrorhamnose 3,5-epimerase|nr:dTDP-4-dehydrorhamnose 3,5-epimerase family protein [Deltaproteobacteria bacterium]
MNITEIRDLPIAGAKLIFFSRYQDNRGYFTETYRKTDFLALARALGLDGFDFQQANESRSVAGVIRGLHFQHDPPMGKLIRLLYGSGVDMALDVRPSSATRGKAIMVDMAVDPSSPEGHWIWLPPGLAHGNFYLAPSAIEYFCNAPYNPAGEVGISPLDPDLDLSLCPEGLRRAYRDLLAEGPILSDKDKKGLSLRDWWADPRAGRLAG